MGRLPMGYRYQYQVERKIKILINYLKQLDDSTNFIKIVDTILRKHNDVCPICRKSMKIYNNEIQNVGDLIYWVSDKLPNYVFLYCVCKSCKKKTTNEQKDAIEQYISEKFKPRVRRKHNTDLLPMLSYRAEFYDVMSEKVEKLGLEKSGFDLVDTYLLYFNGTCPVCRTEIPIDKDEYMDVDRVFFMDEGRSKSGISFCLCKTCTENAEIQEAANLDAEPEILIKALEVVSVVVFEPFD
jgi:hypothetical protein